MEEQSHGSESDNETLENTVTTDSHSQETQSEGIQTEATQAASTDEDVPNADKETEAEDTEAEETEVVEEAPDMDEVTDATTIRERAKAYELAFSKLSQSQVDRLFEMAADGFTQAEKRRGKSHVLCQLHTRRAGVDTGNV